MRPYPGSICAGGYQIAHLRHTMRTGAIALIRFWSFGLEEIEPACVYGFTELFHRARDSLEDGCAVRHDVVSLEVIVWERSGEKFEVSMDERKYFLGIEERSLDESESGKAQTHPSASKANCRREQWPNRSHGEYLS